MWHKKNFLSGAGCAAFVLAFIGVASLHVSSVVNAASQAAVANYNSVAAVKWASIGPRDAGGASGKLNAFAFVESNPKVMYIGGGWGNTPKESPSQMGIYRT